MSANKLTGETSPYLLQHADNPVHWLAWGEEAFARARTENKPILLSVGYAACHWCHVMAHESFEDDATAALMNANFVNVKVDREERPDIDRLYMTALQALGEQGGWPLTMFLAPDGAPFWGGTYFPKESRYGRPSFSHVLTEISRLWREEPEKITQNCHALVHALRQSNEQNNPSQASPAQLSGGETAITSAIDFQNGGLRGAPKFPQLPLLDFLWRRHLQTKSATAEAAVKRSLEQICNGGIYDHLAGGISRYCVDGRWLVPHFEKMLYDNAQFILLLSRVWSQTPNPLFHDRIEQTVSFLLQHMCTPHGAFTSSYDADSEGEEGKFYVWQHSEIAEVLGPELAETFCEQYDVSPEGNWEGKNILNRLKNPPFMDTGLEAKLSVCREQLRLHRQGRVWPAHDDKILADWNGLAIKALAEAGARLQRPEWIEAAERAFVSVMNLLAGPEGLAHSWRANQFRGTATADDFANLIAASLSLYSVTTKATYLTRAEALLAEFTTGYWDPEQGAFYFTPVTAQDVLVRSRYSHDDATPAANGTMISTLHRLGFLTGKPGYEAMAQAIENAFGKKATDSPFAHGTMLASLQEAADFPQAIFIGEAVSSELMQALLALPIADPVIYHANGASSVPENHPAFGKPAAEGKTTLYICRGARCSLPVTEASQVNTAWQALD